MREPPKTSHQIPGKPWVTKVTKRKPGVHWRALKNLGEPVSAYLRLPFDERRIVQTRQYHQSDDPHQSETSDAPTGSTWSLTGGRAQRAKPHDPFPHAALEPVSSR